MKSKDYMPLEEPKYWKSLVTEKTYPYLEYSNIDETKQGYLPLPKDGYPYTLIYEETKYGKWIREMNK